MDAEDRRALPALEIEVEIALEVPLHLRGGLPLLALSGDQHLLVVWALLAAASAGVFLHAGVKFPWFVFFQKDSGLRPAEPPWNMRLAMLFFSALCIGLGVFYEPLYRLLPYAVDYEPYTGWHVVAQLQLLLFSGLAFFVMLGWLKRTLTITLDGDWLYRVLFARLAALGTGPNQALHEVGYWSHLLVFFGFMNYLPLGTVLGLITAFAAVFDPSTPTAIVETMTIDRIRSSPAPQMFAQLKPVTGA